MLKKAAALLLVCASMGAWLGCGSTSNRFLYAAIPSSNEIVAFREDPNSGALIQLVGSPITAGPGVNAVAIHPSKKFLYAANSAVSPGNISLFTIASSGALTESGTRTNAGTAPTLMVMDSAGAFLYVGNSGSNDISVFSIDSSKGTLTPVAQQGGATAPIGLSPFNMQISPSGNVLYVTGQNLLTQGYIEAFSVSNGVLATTAIAGSPFLTGNGPFGLAIDSTGSHLYTANTLDSSISAFTIQSDGSLSLLSTTGQTTSASVSLFIDKSGKYLYVANRGSANLGGFSVGSDGSLTLLSSSPFATGAQPIFVTGDPGGKYLFVGNQSSPVIQSFSLDTGSGTLTSVGTYGVPGTPTSIAITP